MTLRERPRRATVHDVAREAGVSLATVDRVLNGRGGVRQATVGKVEAAIAALGFRRDLSASLLARQRNLNVVFVIPDGDNAFMLQLRAAVARQVRIAGEEKVSIDLRVVPPLNATALCAVLDNLVPEACDCAVVVATDDESVRAAADRAVRRGILLLTLVSDLPGSPRRAFIGIDNAAAGRTAASLLGRFCPAGEVGVIAGSLALSDHRQRLEGFASVLSDQFAGLALVGPVEGRDDDAETEKVARALLESHPHLAGLYNLGAGNAGLVRALESSGRAGRVRVVAHDLAGATREALVSGAIDVVLDQNPDGEVRAALTAARALALGPGAGPPPAAIEIGVFLRDNLGQEGNPR